MLLVQASPVFFDLVTSLDCGMRLATSGASPAGSVPVSRRRERKQPTSGPAAEEATSEQPRCRLHDPISRRLRILCTAAKSGVAVLRSRLLRCVFLWCLITLLLPTEAAVGFRFRGWVRRFTTCRLIEFDGRTVGDIPEFEALVMVNSMNEVVSFEPARAVPMCDISNGFDLAFIPCEDKQQRPSHTRFVFPLPSTSSPPQSHPEIEESKKGSNEWVVTKVVRAAGGLALRAAKAGAAAGSAVVNLVAGSSLPLVEALKKKLVHFREQSTAYGLECMDPVTSTKLKSAINPPMVPIVGQAVEAILDLERK
ncbi:hypothetical protein BESB_066740 [Besnoitia besnoiti]|uniref:Uncharacterized protein n=1 Tax=Besnoitia besnoiti TaxID=94643 RepID=A0A2A9MEE4_BESBE|nr:hypothetical protein BESB_066740 [Besnoitia besnoiti]PFH34641.1 hypothetical protein BESB_066740 [Besnoitia besnoiti]